MKIGNYLKTGAILASIAGVSSLLIASLNLLTGPRISENKANKEMSGLTIVFPDAKVGEGVEEGLDDFSTLKKYWPVELGDGGNARIYSASDKNGYGAVSLLIGIYDNFALGNMVILENTETYGQTLRQNYIAIYEAATTPEERETALNNVSCGATYGAKLIKGMANQAVAHYRESK